MSTSKKNEFVNNFKSKIQADAESVIALYIGLFGYAGYTDIIDIVERYAPEK